MELTSQPKESADNPTLRLIHDAVLNSSAEELEVLLCSRSANVDVPNHKGWTPLMVAAQLGKVQHVGKLLNAGANINKKVEGFSPLELAIKSQKFATVDVLLEAGALTKSNKKESIKERAPALYLACRQNDMRILKAVMDKRAWTINDKKEALLVSLKIENLEAVKVVMERINS